jgi:hypothetical protein
VAWLSLRRRAGKENQCDYRMEKMRNFEVFVEKLVFMRFDVLKNGGVRYRVLKYHSIFHAKNYPNCLKSHLTSQRFNILIHSSLHHRIKHNSSYLQTQKKHRKFVFISKEGKNLKNTRQRQNAGDNFY